MIMIQCKFDYLNRKSIEYCEAGQEDELETENDQFQSFDSLYFEEDALKHKKEMLLAAYLSRNLERFKKLFRELDEKGRIDAMLFRVDDGSINFLEKILMDQRSEEFVLFLSSFQNKYITIANLGANETQIIYQIMSESNLFELLNYVEAKDLATLACNYRKQTGESLSYKIYSTIMDGGKVYKKWIVIIETLLENDFVLGNNLALDLVLKLMNKELKLNIIKSMIRCGLKSHKLNALQIKAHRQQMIALQLDMHLNVLLIEGKEDKFLRIFHVYLEDLKNKENFWEQLQRDCDLFLSIAVGFGLEQCANYILNSVESFDVNETTCINEVCSFGYFQVLSLFLVRRDFNLILNGDKWSCRTVLGLLMQGFYTRNLFQVNFKHAFARDYEKCVELIFADPHLRFRAIINSPTMSPMFSAVAHGFDFAAVKMLQNGFYLGLSSLKWSVCSKHLKPEMLRQFLDSAVQKNELRMDEHALKINYSFLIAPELRRNTIRFINFEFNGVADLTIDDHLMFNKDMETFNLIAQNEDLKHLIKHPVLASYINLKHFKYNPIYHLNLLLYLILYPLPFLVVFLHDNVWRASLAGTFSAFLSLRELLQFLMLARTIWDHFKSPSNVLELVLILLGWTSMATLLMFGPVDAFKVAASLVIILGTVELLMLVATAFSSLAVYLLMLKTVTITFFKTFCVLALLAWAYIFCIYALLRTDEPKSDTDDFKGFVMLAGENDTPGFVLYGFWSKVFFGAFVFVGTILCTLIVGMAIGEVQKLWLEAEFHNLKHKVDHMIRQENVLHYLYTRLIIANATCTKRFLKHILMLLVNVYPDLHKIDSLHVNPESRYVFSCNYMRIVQLGTWNKYLALLRRFYPKYVNLQIRDYNAFYRVFSNRPGIPAEATAKNELLAKMEEIKLANKKHHADLNEKISTVNTHLYHLVDSINCPKKC